MMSATKPPTDDPEEVELAEASAVSFLEQREHGFEVRVRATVARLMDVEMQDQSFRAEIKMEAQWVDDDPNFERYLKLCNEINKEKPHHVLTDWVKQPISGNSVQFHVPDTVLDTHADDEDTIWFNKQLKFFAPRLLITNLSDTRHEERWFHFSRESKGGAGKGKGKGGVRVRLDWLLTGRFQDRLELHNFPFDEQDLCVDLRTGYELQHEKYPVQLCKNLARESVINTRTFVQNSEYYLHPRVQFEQHETHPDESSSHLTYSRLIIKMRVTRHPKYWITSVVVPLFIVTTSLFSTYVLHNLPPDETGDLLTSLGRLPPPTSPVDTCQVCPAARGDKRPVECIAHHPPSNGRLQELCQREAAKHRLPEQDRLVRDALLRARLCHRLRPRGIPHPVQRLRTERAHVHRRRQRIMGGQLSQRLDGHAGPQLVGCAASLPRNDSRAAYRWPA